MKYLVLACCLCLSAVAQSQSPAVVRSDTGRINGAYYQIDVPANWNRKLVMYAHGYETIGTPSSNGRASLQGVAGLF